MLLLSTVAVGVGEAVLVLAAASVGGMGGDSCCSSWCWGIDSLLAVTSTAAVPAWRLTAEGWFSLMVLDAIVGLWKVVRRLWGDNNQARLASPTRSRSSSSTTPFIDSSVVVGILRLGNQIRIRDCPSCEFEDRRMEDDVCLLLVVIALL